jgi:hypothetical protein
MISDGARNLVTMTPQQRSFATACLLARQKTGRKIAKTAGA